MKHLFLLLLTFFLHFPCTSDPQYRVAKTPWEAGLGNHRAVLQVNTPADVVYLDLTWRRHDKSPDHRKFIIIQESTGNEIKNIHRIEVDNIHCELAFGPVLQPGINHFYYLPFEVQERYGFYSKGYLMKEPIANDSWIKENKLDKKRISNRLPRAECLALESRTAFDSFYPMEVIALNVEQEAYKKRFQLPYYLFAESREFPIRMLDALPKR